MLWLALRDVEWRAVADLFRALQAWQIAVLFFVNLGIIVLLGARWWMILRAQGYPLPLPTAVGIRMAAFSISYFTPGPHFGGEPVQAYLAARHGDVPAGTAAASVVLDKTLELAANFAFLAFGVGVLLAGGLLKGQAGPLGLGLSVVLLVLPLGYLFALVQGRTPLAGLGRRLNWQRHNLRGRLLRLAQSAETEAGLFVISHRLTFILAVLLSGIIWAALIFEFALAVRFLGQPLDFWQIIGVMAAARIAILLPVPAGLGTLETALVLVAQALGEGAALGAGLSLLIRIRDLSFGLAGLWLGRRLAR